MTLASEFLGGIKSIQRGTISGYSGVTATITSVDISRCVLRATSLTPVFNGINAYSFPKVSLTNSTTLTMTTYSGTSGASLNFEIIEYSSRVPVKSIQYVSASAGSGGATISAVDPNKSTVSWLGSAAGSQTGANAGTRVGCEIANSTSITFTESNSGTMAGTHYFQVVEFY